MKPAFWNAVRFGRRAKGVQPPIYEALFANGTFTRKSFWSDMRSPLNPADGRPDPVRYMLEDVVDHRRSISPMPHAVRLLAGWVEYRGGRWRDPGAGDVAAVNDGSPLVPDTGVPETPSQEAIEALQRRKDHKHWLALLKRTRLAARRRSKAKEAA